MVVVVAAVFVSNTTPDKWTTYANKFLNVTFNMYFSGQEVTGSNGVMFNIQKQALLKGQLTVNLLTVREF